MKTLYRKIGDNLTENIEAIKEAAEILQKGGLVAFPTETVYGLGASALLTDAAKRIYEAKGRPSDNPLIVHVSSKAMLYDIAEGVCGNALKLIDMFWPGPLTVVLKKKAVIPDVISGGLNTVAVRMPENNVALQLIQEAGVPIAAPSANSSSKPSPVSAGHVLKDLDGKIDMVLDGGHTVYGLESTIVDVSGGTVKLLRPGAVTVDMLEEVVGPVDICTDSLEGKPLAPGMKYKHYAPKAALTVVKGSNKEETAGYIKEKISRASGKCGVVTTEESLPLYEGMEYVYSMGPESRPDLIAGNLFDILRALDDDGIDIAFAHAISENGMGHAVMNRLKKAAGDFVMDLNENKQRRILFVCTGNTCRSPMAEALFNHMAASIGGGFSAFSRGVSVYPGSKISNNALAALGHMGHSLRDFQPRQVSATDMEKAELILCMTRSHAEYLIGLFPEKKDAIHTLYSYVKDEENDVSDPFGGNVEVYMDCARELEGLMQMLLDKLAPTNS